MITIETLAKYIASKIAIQLDLDDDKQSIIGYGLIGIVQILTILILLLTIGSIFDFLYESIIIYMGVGFIRKSTGGAHSKSMNGCIIISVLSIVLMSALSRYVLNFSLNRWINITISVIVFFACFIVFYIKVPMDNPNKPIVRPEKIKRLRKQSFIKLGLLLMTSIVFIIFADSYNRFYSIAVSIRMTMLWLLLTLSQPGTSFLNKFDLKIDCILGKFND